MKLILIRLAAIGAMLLFSCLAESQAVIGGWDQSGTPHAVLTNSPARASGAEPIATSNANGPQFLTQQTGYYNDAGSYQAISGPLVGDGGQAVITTNFTTNTVSCYPVNPNGTLRKRVDSAVTTAPRMVAMADFNEDGLTDIAVTNRTTMIGVYFGDGGCGFAQGTATTLTFGGTATQAIGAAKLGGQTHWDVIAADRNASTLDVFIGGGDGGFATAAAYTQSGPTQQLLMRDMNDDGYPDVVLADNSNNELDIFFGTNTGTLGTAQTVALQSKTPLGVTVGDYNRDGVLDVAVPSQGNGAASALLTNGIEVLFGAQVQSAISANNYAVNVSGPSTFLPFAMSPFGSVFGITSGDFNGDAFLDLAVAAYQTPTEALSGIQILSGNGLGQFTPNALLSLVADINAPASFEPSHPFTADLNGDGIPDIIVPNLEGAVGYSPHLTVVLSQAPMPITPSIGTPWQVQPFPGSLLGMSPGPMVFGNQGFTDANPQGGAVNCSSAYGTFLGRLPHRRNLSIQTQYDTTPIWVGPWNVTTCPGCPYSVSDAGFSDGGPGVVGIEIQPGQLISIDVDENQNWWRGSKGSTLYNGLYCIKQSGAQDGTFDGGWTISPELP